MKRMQRTVRLSAVAAITLLSVVASFNVAEAQSRAGALACGKQLQKLCGGMPVLTNNLRECLKKNQGKLSPRCAAFATYVVGSCKKKGRGMRCSIAKPSQRGKAIFSDA